MARVIARDKGLCQIRGPRCTTEAVTVDHIRSWRLGEQYWFALDNLRAACKRCNSGRRTELVIARPAELPAHAVCPPGAFVLCDIAFGKWWVIDPEAGTCTDVTKPGGDYGEESGSNEFDW